MIRVTPVKFLTAEPGILPTVQNAKIVVLSFADSDDGLVEDKAVSTIDAMELVRQVLDSLATLGEPMAQAIGEQFFGENHEG